MTRLLQHQEAHKEGPNETGGGGGGGEQGGLRRYGCHAHAVSDLPVEFPSGGGHAYDLFVRESE
eukprot:371042-Hanusia_phi.AAC.1